MFSYYFVLKMQIYLINDFNKIGSAADKSDLQIGDEILEINGQNVDSFDHAKIIAHIHNVRTCFFIFYFF